MHARAALLCSLSAALGALLAACGPSVVVFDAFGPDNRPAADALHAYAAHAKIPLRVRSVSPLVAVEHVEVKASGALSLDPSSPSVSDGVLSVDLVTGDAGAGTVEVVDESGGSLAKDDVTVAEPDAISLAVTAPATPGIELPALDPSSVRVFAGGKAAFRTTLTKAGDELVGIGAVTATSPDAAVTVREDAVGCAPDTCDAVRGAVEVSVGDGAGPVEISLKAGSAVAALHVVPTVGSDVTDLVLEEAEPVSGQGRVVAHVLARTEPVYGAPVLWDVDGKAVLDDKGNAAAGDALTFDVPPPNENKNVPPPTHAVAASLGEQSAGARVTAGGNFAVTSITAACGAVPGSTATLAVLLAALAATRRRFGIPPRR